ncbi:MAG: hypothetical protein BVN35_14485 [Proteobacteria bacterium ST_bin11]|nr:MAG: hypothetical protein BVN35_14485 [Proteobacteria bacterium ST_bin11]
MPNSDEGSEEIAGIDWCDMEKTKAIEKTVLAVRLFSILNIVFDLVFSIAGLLFFEFNLFFVLTMIIALVSTMYVFNYADELHKHSREPKKTPSLWFWENNSFIWRYAVFKLVLIVVFILMCIGETARIDVVHVLLNLNASMIIVVCVLLLLAFIMLCLAVFSLGKHHRYLGEIFTIYDSTAPSSA